MVILPDTDLEDASCRAEQVREGVKHLNIFSQGQLLETITLSLGVAVHPDHGKTAETLLRAADDALYEAKARGRNQVVAADLNN